MPQWNFTTGNIVQSSPAVGSDGTVYFGSSDKNVYAVDGATGALKWKFTCKGWVYSSPAIGACTGRGRVLYKHIRVGRVPL